MSGCTTAVIKVLKDAWNVRFLSRASGGGIGVAELLAIGGDAGNVFDVAEFDLLDGKLDHSRDLGKSCVNACQLSASDSSRRRENTHSTKELLRHCRVISCFLLSMR